MTFRLATLLYLSALIGASLAAFGAMGVLVAGGLLGCWGILIAVSKRSRIESLVVILIFNVLLVLLIPAVKTSVTPRTTCRGNMKYLGLAILNYESARRKLPPPVTQGDLGTAEASWRVLVLPYFEAVSFYSFDYDFDEPWDGPNNNKLFGSVVWEEHTCPCHPLSTETNYFAITGAQTAWGDGGERKLSDIRDETSSTILLIEAAGRGVHWAEPKDLTFDEAVELLTTPIPPDNNDGHRVNHGYFYKPSFVRNILFCDGNCFGLAMPLPREAAVAFLTANGGEAIDQAWLDYYGKPQLDFGKIWGLSLFIVIALLPGIPGVQHQVWPSPLTSRSPA